MNQDRFEEDLIDEIMDTVRKCRSCMNCYTVCPLMESTRGLQSQGPHGIIRSIYYAIRWDELEGENKDTLRDVLYLCTTCRSCDIKCKASAAGVTLVDTIENGRKLLVEKTVGPLPEQVKSLESIATEGNPYGEPASARLNWIRELMKQKDLRCKILPDDGTADVLLYAGCTASYNERIQQVASALITIMERMGADYGILKDDRCCGSPARRIGEEGLFQELSEGNLKILSECGVKHIVTISPHCYNTFVNEYPEGMAKIKVQHYTQYLSEVLGGGEVEFRKKLGKTVTYHDPCYLGKQNQVFEEPRKLLSAIPGLTLVEMARNRQDSVCCGGGGGRMWTEVEEIHRLSEIRVSEAETTGAQLIATACPWCHIQIEDALKAIGKDSQIELRDIAEILAEAI